jgi:hypothetical protein
MCAMVELLVSENERGDERERAECGDEGFGTAHDSLGWLAADPSGRPKLARSAAFLPSWKP